MNGTDYNAARSGSNVGCSDATFYFQFYLKLKGRRFVLNAFFCSKILFRDNDF